MNKGDQFNVAGYDVVARAACAEGGGNPNEEEFLVLNNNSTHYLVASRPYNKPYVFLVASYAYIHSEPSLAYGRALKDMTALALNH